MIRSACKSTSKKNRELWSYSKIKNCLVIYWGIVKSGSVMHFKGASVARTELKKAKSKTFSGVQCRIAKCFLVATVLLPDDWHTCSPDSCHHCTKVLSDGIRDAFCFLVHCVKSYDFGRTAFHVNNLSVYY